MKASATFIAFTLSTILFSACKQKNTTTNSDSTATDSLAATAVKSNTADSTNTEYLDYRAIRINGKARIDGSYKQLLADLGKADSVKKFDEKSEEYECGTAFEKPLSVVYIQGVSYELKNDSVAFDVIKFAKEGSFIQAGNVKLNAATTLADIQKLYPESAKQGEEITAAGYSQPVVSISINTSVKPTDAMWVLLFDKKTGKLLELHSWMPC